MKSLIAITIASVACSAYGAEIIQLSIMSPVVKKHQWAWVRMGLKIGENITPVEYEWRDGRILTETVCRNSNENVNFEDCMDAAKIIFGNRCRILMEQAYCEAETLVRP